MKYVFIHGLGQNSSSWDKTFSFMKDKNDFFCPDLLTDNIQNANLIIIKNSGHEVNNDNPERLAFEIEKFYKNIGG